MGRIGCFILHISVAIYLFAHGIIGISNDRTKGIFGEMLGTFLKKGGLLDALTIVLSVCAIAAGIFMLLALFRIEIPITDIILLAFIVLWIIFIIIVNIINPISNGISSIPVYLTELAPNLMVLGALVLSTRRFGGNN